MSQNTQAFDTSHALQIQRYLDGIQLVRPEQACQDKKTVSELLALPFNVYFLSPDASVLNINDVSASLSGFNSASDAIGRSYTEVCTESTFNQVFKTDKEVLQYNVTKIVDDSVVMSDGHRDEYFTIKMPCYNNDRKVVGTFGMSMLLGTHPLAASLEQIAEFGFVNLRAKNNGVSESKHDVLTRREKECLNYLSQGFRSKEIAFSLGLSHRTISNYLENIKSKMNVRSTQALLVKMLRS